MMPLQLQPVFIIPKLPTRKKAYRKILKEVEMVLDKYANEILLNLDRVDEIVKKAIEDKEFILALVRGSEVVYKIFKSDPEGMASILKKELDESFRHLRKCELDVSEHVDILISHDLWKFKMLLENPIKLFSLFSYYYSEGYLDELEKYVVAYMGCGLLLYLIPQVDGCKTLSKIVSLLSNYSEELDSYLTTFIELIESEDEDYIVESCGDEACVKNLLM